ncbi:MAG: hypothetical protein KAJ91_04740 [Candidatus Aenigmarchaeota archaeon]|nr:hypothetical protein [Candidatus Aenigmarchaeota archaeon]
MFLTTLDFMIDGVLFRRRKQRSSKTQEMQGEVNPMCNNLPNHGLKQSKSRQATIGLKNTASLFELKNPRLKLVGVLVLFCFVSFVFFRHQFFILLFVLVGAASRMLQKFIPVITGVDFCLFFSILVSVVYSPTLGIITGVSASLIGSFLRHVERAEYYMTPVYGYVPIWVFMSLRIIPELNIMLTGMLCVAVYVVARFMAIFFTNKICIASQLTYVSTALIFNYWLFSGFAPFLMGVMV